MTDLNSLSIHLEWFGNDQYYLQLGIGEPSYTKFGVLKPLSKQDANKIKKQLEQKLHLQQTKEAERQ